MWNIKRRFFFLLYKTFASWLPCSQRMPWAKGIRCFFARRVISSCGKNVNIERNAFFTPEVRIGDNSGIGINCEIYGPVSICEDVMMGPDVIIYTRGHRYDRIDVPIRLQGNTDVKPVTIERDVWIGRRAMIMPGVTIGHGSVIAAGAVVTKNVPPYSVVGGIPARVLKMRYNVEENC